MSVNLTIDGQTTAAVPNGPSLFELAESLGVRVPTSCRMNGKCKECIVEVTSGMDALTPRTPRESHLAGEFRLSCQTRVAAGEGEVTCHTMRRGRMRIERHALGLPNGILPRLEPAVSRDGD